MHGSCNSYDPTVEDHQETYTEGEAPIWDRLMLDHQDKPFHVMNLGGDQLYMDFVSFQLPHFHQQPLTCWENLHDGDERRAFWTGLQANANSQLQLENSMLRHYLRVFNEGPINQALANIPEIMMWDDHGGFLGRCA